ncbi:hypothetical protein [Komagataeibacter europaeus]|uniref:hypothetical protein n=1 Tax=Komagataeibacter europaeus TaxID=33995 RepID=UPI0012F88635|nr:hypothetical protein [Komagataeibacter europaeus]
MLEKPPIELADGMKEGDRTLSIPQTLVLMARVWAAPHPFATIEVRQHLAAMVATELAGRG